MKNIITIVIILVLPILIYSLLNKNSGDITAFAQENGRPSLFVFTSSMCMDCQKMKTIIKEVEPSYNTRINFIQVNATEKNRKVKELVKQYSVVLVPTMIFVNSDKQEIKRLEGYIPKEQFVSEIEEVING